MGTAPSCLNEVLDHVERHTGCFPAFDGVFGVISVFCMVLLAIGDLFIEWATFDFDHNFACYLE